MYHSFIGESHYPISTFKKLFICPWEQLELLGHSNQVDLSNRSNSSEKVSWVTPRTSEIGYGPRNCWWSYFSEITNMLTNYCNECGLENLTNCFRMLALLWTFPRHTLTLVGHLNQTLSVSNYSILSFMNTANPYFDFCSLTVYTRWLCNGLWATEFD